MRTPRHSFLVTALGLAWVAAVTVAYLWQFRTLAAPVLSLLGVG
jgi:hypothetical protein